MLRVLFFIKDHLEIVNTILMHTLNPYFKLYGFTQETKTLHSVTDTKAVGIKVVKYCYTLHTPTPCISVL